MTVRVVRRRELPATAKLDEKTTGIPKMGWALSPETIRVAQTGEVYFRTIIDLLDAGTEKPP